jgi:Aerotolerance regulator N-terminal/von Willebrand factor type A domain
VSGWLLRALAGDGLLAFGFANPWLLSGLALGAIPIVIHLLSRRAYRETDWAAMRFLLEAARKNSRRMRLEQLILLAVRTLILLLAALAFAEPLVEAVSPQARPRTLLHRLIVIDASFSMGARTDAGTRFDRAKSVARQIVADSEPGDAVSILRIAGHTPPAVVREPAFEQDVVLPEIDRLQLTDEPGELGPALAEAAEILADSRAPRAKEVIFVSDFQRVTWGDDRSAKSDVPALFKKIAEKAKIVLVGVGDGRTDNAAITSLASADPIVLPDRPARLRAAIRNFGPSPLAGLRCELYADNYLVAFKAIDVPAREETAIEFPYEFRRSGEHAVEVRLPADRLAADNRRWLSVPVTDQIRVLVVNGHEGGRPAENASHYVRTVLAPSTARESWSGATQPKVINEADLTAEDLSKFDCVFLCNVALVTRTEADLLQAYAEAGGGIVFALGDRVKPANYNAVLYRDGKGVLPALLEGPVGNARDPVHGGYTFDASDLSHPIVAPFRGNPGAGLDRVVTLEYLQARLAAGSPSRVALKFSSGDPAIVERQVGRGRCVLLTTSADVSWSTWAVHPTFPPLIHETVRFAAEGRWHERQRLVGEPISRTLTGRESSAKVTVKSPDGSEQALRPVVSDNRADVSFAATNHPGIYDLMMEGPAEAGGGQPSTAATGDKSPGSVRHELYAVNVDPRESDLEMVDDKTLGSTTLAGVSYERRTDWGHESRELGASEPATSAVSRWLLVAILALLLVEPLLAWNFRRGFVALCALAVAGLGFVVFRGQPRFAAGLAVVIGLGVLVMAGIQWWRGARGRGSRFRG